MSDVIRVLKKKGQNGALNLMRRLDPRPSALEFNRAGYAYLETGRIQEAVSLFEFNTAAHPDYANGFDSLAEGLERAGRFRDAMTAYLRALELDPSNDNAVARVKALQASLDEDP